eukprot:558847-Prymnesium_polylepis.1
MRASGKKTRACAHGQQRDARARFTALAESHGNRASGSLKPLFNVCAKFRPAPLSQANLDEGRAKM